MTPFLSTLISLVAFPVAALIFASVILGDFTMALKSPKASSKSSAGTFKLISVHLLWSVTEYLAVMRFKAALKVVGDIFLGPELRKDSAKDSAAPSLCPSILPAFIKAVKDTSGTWSSFAT